VAPVTITDLPAKPLSIKQASRRCVLPINSSAWNGAKYVYYNDGAITINSTKLVAKSGVFY
jgi:hypothetical protein